MIDSPKLNTAKDYILFYFDENLYNNYHHFLSKIDFDACFHYTEIYDLKNSNNKVILNITDDANILNDNKLEEIKELCMLFNNDYFYFLSGDINNGVCFKFGSEEDNIVRYDDSKDSFFSFLLPYNFWLTNGWCKWVSGGMSDIKIGGNITINFNHELLITKKENFNKIEEVYTKKYGVITPILQYKSFLEKVFESEFNYLLSDNIYITSNSIDYIKNQL